MHNQARRLQALCLKQDETLIALRNMSEDDMRLWLKYGGTLAEARAKAKGESPEKQEA